MPSTGPFAGVTEFHDWLSSLTKRLFPDPSLVPDDLMRHIMPDNARIILSHGDLRRSNIMVSRGTPCQVLAIIDWHQSGWYPAYWEYSNSSWRMEGWIYSEIPRGSWLLWLLVVLGPNAGILRGSARCRCSNCESWSLSVCRSHGVDEGYEKS